MLTWVIGNSRNLRYLKRVSNPISSLCEQRLQLLDDLVPDLFGGAGTANVFGDDSLVDDEADCLLHQSTLLGHVQGVEQEHGDAQDGGDGVDDSLTRDVGGGTVDGFVDAVTQALAVGHAAQAGAGQQTQTSRDDRCLVGDDVSEQVGGDDDSVEGPRVLDHDHGGRVNQLVFEFQLGEFLLHGLGEDAAPEPAGGEHVGLVQTPDFAGRGFGQGQVGRQAGDSLNLPARVGLAVLGELVRPVGRVAFDPVAKVDATGEFTDDHEVCASTDFLLQGRARGQRRGGEEARPEVAKGTHLLAEFEESLFRSDLANAVLGPADGSQEDGVGGFGGLEGFVGQRCAMGVDGALYN